MLRTTCLCLTMLIIWGLMSLTLLVADEAHPPDMLEAQKYYLETGLYDTIEEEYYVKPGDMFFISIIGAEPEEMLLPVSISGNLILHPITTAVSVGGKSLRAAKETIMETLSAYFHDVKICVQLQSISPQRIHILGAVNQPGEYVVDSLLTLQSGMELAGGITPAGSKNVNLIRKGRSRRYDLNRYRFYGELQQNPVLFNDDVVYVDFAEKFAKVYVVTDSVNYVEYFDVEEEKPVSLLLRSLSRKFELTDYSEITVYRDEKMIKVDKEFKVRADDVVYVDMEKSFIFVRGSVNNPGKFNFVPGQCPEYYISHAGGITRDGTGRRIIIIGVDGSRERFVGQRLEEGDTVVVPLSTRAVLTDYLTPISTALSLFATIFVLTN